MKNKTAITSLAVAAVLAGGVGAVSAQDTSEQPQERPGYEQREGKAWNKDFRKKKHYKAKRSLHHPWHKETHKAMKEAFESGDYEAYKKALEDNYQKQLAYMTPERFAQFTELSELREAGDMEAARDLMKQIMEERKALRQ